MQQTATAVRDFPRTKTFLDELNAILASGTFEDSDAPVATDDEPVISTMTDYERALYTLAQHCVNGQRELMARNFNGLNEYVGEEPRDRIVRQINSFKERYDAAMALLWTSIKDRLHDTLHAAADRTGIAVRQGFKGVLMFEAPDCLDGLDDLLRHIFLGRGR